jgi:Reverse transcriptase (RNA-dependent DNA polymerase)
MGLDRSPGPDGISMRFLKKEWAVLGSSVVQLMIHSFNSGHIPENWRLSNLVLIPKTEHPLKPCSVYYRLFLKLITNRLKPVIANLVSQNQAVFLKGRSIHDNVLLMNEMMHSFQDRGYNEKAFVLKADLYEAFDCLNLFSKQTFVLRAFWVPYATEESNNGVCDKL